VVEDYPNRSISGAESGKVVGPESVLVAPAAKQSETVGHATDSSDALGRPGGFCAAQLNPFHSQACGRVVPLLLLSGPKPTISQRELEMHEMPFGVAADPRLVPWTLQPFPSHRSANTLF
jgi:hypothetical protein